MSTLLKHALVGALALAGVAAAAPSASAMPVSGLAPVVSGDAGTASGIDKVYWHRHFGWRRPLVWRHRFGWHPYGWHRYGWHRPFGWHHRWHRW